MINPSNKEPETYSEAETEARGEAALKRLLVTPHKPHGKAKKDAKRSNGGKGQGA